MCMCGEALQTTDGRARIAWMRSVAYLSRGNLILPKGARGSQSHDHPPNELSCTAVIRGGWLVVKTQYGRQENNESVGLPLKSRPSWRVFQIRRYAAACCTHC